MSTNILQQEILLIATTTFSKNQCCGKEPSEQNNHQSHKEHLEEICWNGLLDEILPEILERSSAGKGLYLWQIRQAEFYIQIELCSYPSLLDKQLSIDPYFFLPTRSGN